MSALRSTLDPKGEAYTAAASAAESRLDEIDAELAKALGGGGPKYVERHHARGKLTARERIELLVDGDSPFLELSPLAAYGSAFQIGASTVVGIGVVSGVECLIVANDPTVKGGTSNPWTLRKILRPIKSRSRTGCRSFRWWNRVARICPPRKRSSSPVGRCSAI